MSSRGAGASRRAAAPRAGLAAEVEREVVGGEQVGRRGQPAGGAEGHRAAPGSSAARSGPAASIRPSKPLPGVSTPRADRVAPAAASERSSGGDAIEAGAAELAGEARRMAVPGEAALGHQRLGRAAGLQPGVQPLQRSFPSFSRLSSSLASSTVSQGGGRKLGSSVGRPGQADLATDQGDLARLQPAGQQRAEVEPQPQRRGR